MNLNDLYHTIQDKIGNAISCMQSAELAGIDVVPLNDYIKITNKAMNEFEADRGFFDEEEFNKVFDPNCIASPYDELLKVLNNAIEQVNELKIHKHYFVIDDETDQGDLK